MGAHICDEMFIIPLKCRQEIPGTLYACPYQIVCE